ncbi:hypothetical protein [Streptomyces tubercidicus]|uniref:hypothetical protein n=1 Tax=Streptomyces tubercidicus TaxID=47759 RepID=UPI00369FE59C
MSDTTPTNGTAPADEFAAQIRALVDAAPPLSLRQRERLRLVLRARPRADTGNANSHRPGSGRAAA